MAKIEEQNGLFELTDTDGLDPSLSNADFLPTPIKADPSRPPPLTIKEMFDIPYKKTPSTIASE